MPPIIPQYIVVGFVVGASEILVRLSKLSGNFWLARAKREVVEVKAPPLS
jgi:hypothetical protein